MELRSEDVKRLEEMLEELENERKEYADNIGDLEFRIRRDKKIITFYYEQLDKRSNRIEAVKKAINMINRYIEILALVEQALAEKGYFGNEFTTYIATKRTVVEVVQTPCLAGDSDPLKDKRKSG
jgi:chromosome segregation ATPase